jgi:hypothetical protein
MNIHHAEQKDFPGCARWQRFRKCLAATDGSDLLLAQPDVLSEEALQVKSRLRTTGRASRGR